jgi:uncharacterized integral membrane protein
MNFLLQEVGPKGVVSIAIFLAVVIGLLIAIIIAIGYRIKKRLAARRLEPTNRKRES